MGFNRLDMKCKKNIALFSLVFAITLISCEEQILDHNQETILGTWISVNNTDTLDFVNDSSFYRSSLNMRYDHYDYKLYRDSIKIRYRGKLYIYVYPTKHKYSIDKNTLIIDFTNKNCYGFSRQVITFNKVKH